MTTIGPLRHSANLRALIAMRERLDALQLQLSTGRKSETFAGLGGGRAPALDAHAKIAAIDARKETIDRVNLRLSVIESTLIRFDALAVEQRGANLDTSYVPVSGGYTIAQVGARQRFAEMIDTFNQEVDGRRLFSGRATDKDAATSLEAILDGVPPALGLKGVIAERAKADRGINGLGRLDVAMPTMTSVRLADTASGPFGFRIASVSNGLGQTTLTEVLGPPRSMTVDFGGLPSPGQSWSATLTLPGGGTSKIALAAVAGPAGPGTFAIGPDPATTALNFDTALQAELQAAMKRDLMPASALLAAEGFFAVDDATPPTRVDIVTIAEEATGTRPATMTDTVRWYLGDGALDDPRASATARVDSTVTVGYGLRANEPGFRRLLANLGAFAALELDPNDAEAKNAYASLSLAVRDRLGAKDGQTIRTIQSEIAVVRQTVALADTRQTATRGLLMDLLADIEGVSKEEIAARIVELQTRLEAGYRTSALLSQLSLVKFL